MFALPFDPVWVVVKIADACAIDPMPIRAVNSMEGLRDSWRGKRTRSNFWTRSLERVEQYHI